MWNNSTQVDPSLQSQESLEFEFGLRNKVVGQKEAVRALVERHSGAFK